MKSSAQSTDFIRKVIENDLASGRHKRVVTRFPPEPNGFLHIGHAKSIWLNFEVAEKYGGHCWLRMDDTNPAREDRFYEEAIQQDIQWLGFQWHQLSHASDYFDRLYELAKQLIEQGDAYVDSQPQEAIRAQRGTLTMPGKNSPYRDRSVDENMRLFEAMRDDKFGDGEQVLRARIDMTSPNINLRDPVLYRIRHVEHQRTGTDWCLYPMYDYAHCLCDVFEEITHSLCTLEFEDHRHLYDWILAAARTAMRPQQIEFSRLQLAQTVTSKRQLGELVATGQTAGWDDPRMPTLAGLRRRGVPAAAILDFCSRTGVTRKYHIIEAASFDHSVRACLEPRAPRAFAVLDPLKLVIDNWPAEESVTLPAPWHPDEKPGCYSDVRQLSFGRDLYIERDDFSLNPPKGYRRLTPGADVRLRYGYIVRCGDPEFDDTGEVVAVHCTFYKDSRSGQDTSGIHARGVIHWLPMHACLPARVQLYDALFKAESEDSEGPPVLNTDSLTIYDQAQVERVAVEKARGEALQFERLGYFIRDIQDADEDLPVFNRTLRLRDSKGK